MAARSPKAPKVPKEPKTPRAPKVPKSPPPAAEDVAGKLFGLFLPGEPPALWKDAELKRRLTAVERPLLAAALARLQAERQVLALTQGKTVFYLFAGPLRGWLADAPVRAEEVPPAPAANVPAEDLFAVYARLVRQSGGFPDVKISALWTALGPGYNGDLSARLTALWQEGRATLSQGDWSLADKNVRAAAVELAGERYLLVRLDGAAD